MLLKHEKYIIRKGNRYLVGCPYDDTSYCRYSDSKYDGTRMKDFNKAIRIAKLIDGRVMKLNELTGTLEGGWR